MSGHTSFISSKILWLLAGIGLVSGACTGSRSLNKQVPVNKDTAPDYSLIYVIHGDGDYLYHDDGKAIKADEHAVKKAYSVALKAHHGEVFIFHQKPERKAALFFPKKDREWFHYRNGKLIDYGTYSPQNGGFQAEARIYTARTEARNADTYFFYFGHEIPQAPNPVYHRSASDLYYDSRTFARDLSLFSNNIALTTLSTCNNGTPSMIRSLSGKTEAVVASPTELHLSYLDTEGILMLENAPDTDVIALADTISMTSYQRLSQEVATAVTIAVYDLRVVSEYVDELYEPYLEYKNSTSVTNSRITTARDCFSLPEYANIDQTEGVQVFYSAPQFGVKKRERAATHSGWGCK